MDDINEHISRILKKIRKEKGLTLDELADMTGVSKSMIGEIERGGTNPTILTLWKIADGLKVPLTYLIGEAELDFRLVRAAEAKTVSRTDEYGIYSIFPYHGVYKNEILRLEIAPHSRLANSGHLNGIDEFVFVIKGKVRLGLNGEEIILEAGDSIRFKGELAHAFDNDRDEGASLLNILYYRTVTARS